jgi:hypothetical protein
MGSITLNKPSGGQLTISPEDGTSNETVTIPSVGVGKVLQVVTSSTTAGGATNGSSPAYNAGYNLFATPFTPKSSNSTIIVQTSDVYIGEESNYANLCWLGAWANTTEIGVTSGTVNAVATASALNFAYKSLNHSINSWGAGEQRTINVRASMDSGPATVYVNFQSYSDFGVPAYRTVGLTIWEVAA